MLDNPIVYGLNLLSRRPLQLAGVTLALILAIAGVESWLTAALVLALVGGISALQTAERVSRLWDLCRDQVPPHSAINAGLLVVIPALFPFLVVPASFEQRLLLALPVASALYFSTLICYRGPGWIWLPALGAIEIGLEPSCWPFALLLLWGAAVEGLRRGPCRPGRTAVISCNPWGVPKGENPIVTRESYIESHGCGTTRTGLWWSRHGNTLIVVGSLMAGVLVPQPNLGGLQMGCLLVLSSLIPLQAFRAATRAANIVAADRRNGSWAEVALTGLPAARLVDGLALVAARWRWLENLLLAPLASACAVLAALWFAQNADPERTPWPSATFLGPHDCMLAVTVPAACLLLVAPCAAYLGLAVAIMSRNPVGPIFILLLGLALASVAAGIWAPCLLAGVGLACRILAVAGART